MNIKLNQSKFSDSAVESPVADHGPQPTFDVEQPPHEEDLEDLEEEPEAEEDKGIFEEGKHLANRSKDDLNAAFANFMVNVQTTLVATIILNKGISDPKDHIPFGVGFVSILFAYAMSFVMAGDQPFFKGLSVCQAVIVREQIESFGRQSLFYTGFVTGALVLLFTTLKSHRLVRATPFSVIISLKLSIGLKLILKELPALFGIISKERVETLNLWQGIWFIIKNRAGISWLTFSVVASSIGALWSLSKYVPRVPWHMANECPLIAIGVGYFWSHTGRFQTFGEELQKNERFDVFFNEVFSTKFYTVGLSDFKKEIDLEFFLNCTFLALMTF